SSPEHAGVEVTLHLHPGGVDDDGAAARSPARTTGRLIQTFGFGGGSSRASHTDWNPVRACWPSQNGLLADCRQRHSEITVRPARPYSLPDWSVMVNSPSSRSGPWLLTVMRVIGPRVTRRAWVAPSGSGLTDEGLWDRLRSRVSWA